MCVTTVYMLVDGIQLPKTPCVVAMPGSALVERVAFAPSRAAREAWREYDTDLGDLLLSRLCKGDEAALRIHRALGQPSIQPGTHKLRVLDPPTDALGLRKRGVMRLDCTDCASADDIPGLVERLVEELEPVQALLCFAQRRLSSVTDTIVVTDGNLLYRLYETREPVASPARGYGLLIDEDSLRPFLAHALSTWADVDAKTREHLQLAMALHRIACAQRAVIGTRLLEHFAALDIATALVPLPAENPSPKGRAAKCRKGPTQMDQFENARQTLVKDGWPDDRVPSVDEVRTAYKIRCDLAHARGCSVLKLGDEDENRKKILRATGYVVSLLEACLLWHLRFHPNSPPRVMVALPFALAGTGRVQRFWLGAGAPRASGSGDTRDG